MFSLVYQPTFNVKKGVGGSFAEVYRMENMIVSNVVSVLVTQEKNKFTIRVLEESPEGRPNGEA